MSGVPQTQEEIRAVVEARAAEIEGGAEPEAAPQPRRPLQVDLSQFSGVRYLREYPPAFDWLLDKSFRLNSLGAIVGPPGAGKGSLAIQLCVAVASGTSLVGAWHTAAPEPVVYLSAEDDALTIHRRVHHALEQVPEDLREQAAANLYGIPVHGGVNLCRAIGGTVESTANYEDLRNILDAIRPRLLVLDTLARFSGVDENDNPAMTAFCGLLEGLIDAYGCNIILLHHSNKTSGDLIEDPKELARALTQTAMRGASALAGCIRWGRPSPRSVSVNPPPGSMTGPFSPCAWARRTQAARSRVTTSGAMITACSTAWTLTRGRRRAMWCGMPTSLRKRWSGGNAPGKSR